MKQSNIVFLIKEVTKQSSIGKSGKDLIESLELKSGGLFDKLSALQVIKETNYLEIDKELTAYVLKLIDEKRDNKFVKSINKKLIKADPGLIKFLYSVEKPKQKEQKKNTSSKSRGRTEVTMDSKPKQKAQRRNQGSKNVKKRRRFNSSKNETIILATIQTKPKFKDLKAIYKKLENKDIESIAALVGSQETTVNSVFKRFKVSVKEPISYAEFQKAKEWLLGQYDKQLTKERKIKDAQIEEAKKALKSKKTNKSSRSSDHFKYGITKIIYTGMR